MTPTPAAAGLLPSTGSLSGKPISANIPTRTTSGIKNGRRGAKKNKRVGRGSMTTESTRVGGIIGDPLAHVRTARIANAHSASPEPLLSPRQCVLRMTPPTSFLPRDIRGTSPPICPDRT